MTEDFKKWLFKKIGVSWGYSYGGTEIIKEKVTIYKEITPETLIKGMWAINREKYLPFVDMARDGIMVEFENREWFYYRRGESEEETLRNALEYIYEYSKKETKKAVN